MRIIHILYPDDNNYFTVIISREYETNLETKRHTFRNLISRMKHINNIGIAV